MSKRPNLLNNLAIISDIIEKLDFKSNTSTVVIEVSKMEFEDVYFTINKNTNELPDIDTFKITIGGVNFIFSTNNV